MAAILGCALAPQAPAPEPAIDRVTTAVPFPRGMAMVEGELYVLARGRVRDAGGVSAAVDDRAGTLFAIDPDVAEPADHGPVGDAVRANARVVAEPSQPPFILWDRGARPPESDQATDRPYCALRWHEGTQSFYICAFSGIDLPNAPGFNKNASDAILRFDLRTGRWHEVERHDAAREEYPHHCPAHNPPPHGWLKGPDNCLVVGDSLYAVAKDNSVLVRYDLAALGADPEAGPAPSELVLGHRIEVEGLGAQDYFGHSALAVHGEWMYLGYRTSSVIVRFALDQGGRPRRPLVAQRLAVLDPFDPRTGRSADLTDIDVDRWGRVYAVSALPASVHRFTPVQGSVYDGRSGRDRPWLDLAARLGKPRLKCENLLVDGDRLFVSTGDAYDFQQGADGAVYRINIAE
jgi:hypothetical protein